MRLFRDNFKRGTPFDSNRVYLKMIKAKWERYQSFKLLRDMELVLRVNQRRMPPVSFYQPFKKRKKFLDCFVRLPLSDCLENALLAPEAAALASSRQFPFPRRTPWHNMQLWFWIFFLYHIVAYIVSGELRCSHFVQCNTCGDKREGSIKRAAPSFSFGAGWEEWVHLIHAGQPGDCFYKIRWQLY